MQCQICQSNKVSKFLDLGDHPPFNFLKEHQFGQEVKFPLKVCFCPDCGLVQLDEPVAPEILFRPPGGYHHVSALSTSFLEHMKQLAKTTVERFNLTPNDLVVELGSNDGSLLGAFQENEVQVLGVDPSSVADMARKKELTTVPEFFNEEVSSGIVREYGKAKISIALNTFSHILPLDSIMRGIQQLLTEDGVFISENHYLLDIIQGLQYDVMYHEHYRYYSIRSLIVLFDRFELSLFDVERVSTHSGSIRVFACKKGTYAVSENVKKLLKEEEALGLDSLETYEAFSIMVNKHRKALPSMLKGLRNEGYTIAALTASGRGMSLLESCGIGQETLSYATEGSKLKIGRFSPGAHIPIVDQEVLFGDNQPDYGLLLSWHLGEELIPRFREGGFKGKIIIPLPEIKIID